MNFKFIFHDLHANIKTWMRSPGTVFWTVLFPILLILIFGAIFSGGGDDEFNIVVQDLDKLTPEKMSVSLCMMKINLLHL